MCQILKYYNPFSLLLIILCIIHINYVKTLNTNNHKLLLVPTKTHINSIHQHNNSNRNNIKHQHNHQKVPLSRTVRATTTSGGTSGGNNEFKQSIYRKIDDKNNVLQVVKNLDIQLKNIRNYELGVTTLQEIFDAMDFTIIHQNNYEYLQKITNRMSSKFNKILNILSHIQNFFHNNITHNVHNNLNTLIYPCPFNDIKFKQNYNQKQIEIMNYFNIENIPDNNNEPLHSQQQQLLSPTSIGSTSRRESANQHMLGPGQRIDFSEAGLSPLQHHLNNNNDADDANVDENQQILNEFQKFHLNLNHIKQVYFLSKWDHGNAYNCCQYYVNNKYLHYLYVQSIEYKHIFLLIDNGGNTFNMEQLELSKTFVKNILNLISETDTITIVLISNVAVPMILTDDDIPATTNHKNYIYNGGDIKYQQKITNFIRNLNYSTTITNHSLGFQYSFELLKKQQVENLKLQQPIEFLYISRGLLTKLNDTMIVLQTIANGQKQLNSPIVINTCAIILDEKRIMYEKQLLRDIAQQNYTKYEINVTNWYNEAVYNLTGRLYIVKKNQHPQHLIQTSSQIFEGLFNGDKYLNHLQSLDYINKQLIYHKPVFDYNTRDLIISITQTIERIGVIGVNIQFNDLAEDLLYYKSNENSYIFMIDMKGATIYHPSFPRPIATNKNYVNVDIRLLENRMQFTNLVYHQMFTESSGNMTILGQTTNETMIYNWRHTQNAYIICIVSVQKGIFKQSITQSSNHNINLGRNYQLNTETFDLLYHRLDLIPPKTPVCRHFRQIATLDTGTLFLSASAFQSPFIYLKNNRENQQTIRTHTAQSIMAYLKDTTTLLANPGLLPQIRNDVAVLYHVMVYLKKQHQEKNGPFYKSIIRRYVTTTNGVIQIYPGCMLGTDFEPTRRSWYRKAMKYPGKIILTVPYLDAGGAGYIITIAHTIFEGKSNALHNFERDLPIAIVAIDLPYTFFYKLIIDSSGFCLDTNMKCLLIEDTGYLIGHPSFMEPATNILNMRRPIEHITHKESFVANDILNHKQLVRKRVCANYINETIQRYYTYNISLMDVLTNVVHGDRTKYQITVIPGTNIFAAVLNSTCDGGAFCPCSTVDRICLNCNRMDQTDCECPCECPLNNINNRKFISLSPSYDYCEPEIEDLFVVNSLSYNWNTVLKACVNINCDVYPTQNECLGVMGCEWCQLDVDGNPYNSGFCTTQTACFNGVLGSQTPYGDSDIGPLINEESIQPAYSAVGPVGGAIIVSIIIVGFAMYCYRQNLDNSSDHLYPPDSIQDDNYGLPLSRFNFDDLNVTPRDDSDLIGRHGSHILHKNLIHPLANSIAVSDISPYHMSSCGYRRPTNGESDNGYSTMTPHEDSEHMCFNLVEPLINSKRLSMSADSMSIGTSISSPTNNHHHNHQHSNSISYEKTTPSKSNILATQLSTSSPNRSVSELINQTMLPQQLSPHHVLAPVTFHRHMEA